MPERISAERLETETTGSTGIKRKRLAVFKDLGVLEYKKALELQIKTRANLNLNNLNSTKQIPANQSIHKDTVFFVEHLSVFTLGKRGGEENLSVPKTFLSAQNIDIVQTNRGGNITWHGPGQAVLYPVIDLERNRIGVKDFVHGLEEIMILTAQDFKISAKRDQKNHGIWVGNAKMGSVGVNVKKGISMHGLALNINPDLKPFSWINPCGLHGISITSIEKEVDKTCSMESKLNHYDFSMDKVKQKFIKYFSKVFNFQIVMSNEI